MKPDDGLIVALATPPGQSAIALLRTSGPGCVEAVAKICRNPGKVRGAAGHSLVRTTLVDQEGNPVDDVVLGVYRAPRSYTGEESVEISCHGSIPGIEAIMGLLLGQGFRQAQGGEFTLRAFLNGKMDLTRAEAVQEIVAARSREAQVHALHRLGGALERRINAIKADLVQCAATLAVQLDYAEDEVELPDFDSKPLRLAHDALASLAASYSLGRRYQHGVRIAIAGKTNAGKSSLFNALVREDRAIVSDVHGTTRDYLEAQLIIGGIPVRLFDTAGIRATDELIEREGIERSGRVIESAALVLYVLDGTLGFDGSDGVLIDKYVGHEDECLVVWNKVDKCGKDIVPKELQRGDRSFEVLGTSAWSLEGFDRFHELLTAKVRGSAAQDAGELLLDNERQHHLVHRAEESVLAAVETLAAGYGLDAVALEVQEAIGALGELTGEVTSDDILEVMFSGFCVGK